MKLRELGGKLSQTTGPNNRPHAVGERRNFGEGPKKMKEVMCSRVVGQVVAVKKRECKEESVPGVEGKVNPGGPGVFSHARLTSGRKETGEMFVMSKSRKQMWDRMKKRVVSTAPLAPAHVKKMKDYMPKGKTYRRGVNKILS